MLKENQKFICPHCGEVKDNKNQLDNHIYNTHRVFNKSVKEAMSIYAKQTKWVLSNLDKEVLKKWFERHKEYNNYLKLYDKQFNHFYELITFIREWQDSDFDVFFGPFLDWKIKNPKVANCIEMCHIAFPGQPEIAQKLYNEKMRAKNPFVGHGKELSPFSKDFIGYKDMSDKEKEEAQKAAAKHHEIGRNPNQVEYWEKKGYSTLEAQRKVRERQITFSKEICVEKHGEEEGLKIWKERQEKWQSSILSKSPEELERINRAKMNNGKGYSKVSQKMFWEIMEKIKDKVDINDVFFATLDRDKGVSDYSGKNHEYFYIGDNRTHFFFDFLLKSKKRIIEFDGEYWHSNKIPGRLENDAKREKMLKAAGYQIHHVDERDYRREPIAMVYEAVQFLLED